MTVSKQQWALAAILIVACGGHASQSLNTSQSGGTGGTGGMGTAGASHGGSDASGGVAGTYSGGSGGSSGQAGAGGAMLEDVPSHQTVKFEFTNPTTSARYVVVQGTYCPPYAVAGPSGPIQMAVDYQCGCECPMGPPMRATAYQLVAPGETFDLVWDARVLVVGTNTVPCNFGGLPPDSATVQYGVLQPAAAGDYDVMFGIEDAPPSDCFGTPIATCDSTPNATLSPSTVYACGASQRVKVRVALPAGGNVNVPVELP